MDFVRRNIVPVIVAAIAALGGITVAIVAGVDQNGKPTANVTIKVDGPDRDAKPDDPVVLTPADRSVEQTLKTKPNDVNGPYRGVAPQSNLSGTVSGPVAKLQPPFASDSIPGCRTRTLRTNWSQRSASQSQVVLFWLHYTGGPDRPGTRSDVDGLTAFGNNSSAGVSWHFNMDKDGNCDYNVPLRYKAWTEAGANSTGISIEVAGTGSPPYLRPGGITELRRIIQTAHSRYPGITFRLGGVSSCHPTRGGIVTHWMGGPCSGGHTDIKPLSITNVINQLKSGGAKPVPHRYTVWCREYAHYKREVAKHTFNEKNRSRAVAVRNALSKAHYSCSIRGVAKKK